MHARAHKHACAQLTCMHMRAHTPARMHTHICSADGELVHMMLGEELSRHDWEQERALIQTARLRLLIERRALASEPPTPAIDASARVPR